MPPTEHRGHKLSFHPSSAYTPLMREDHRAGVSRFLRGVAPLNDEEVERFCALASDRYFRKGEVFVRAGEVCETVLFIHQGIFRYYLLSENKEVTKDFSPEGSTCAPLTSLFTRTPSQFYIEALEDSETSLWRADDVRALLARPAWQPFARHMLFWLFARKEQREISLLLDTPIERYGRFLRDFPSIATPPGSPDDAAVKERVPQHYVASYLGIAPETLSRVKRSLQTS